MKATQDETSPVYQRDIMEFATVAVQFCVCLEQLEGRSRSEFEDTMLKLLPLLYLKGELLPVLPQDESVRLPEAVTEENYEIVRHNIACIMAEDDDYLDVFVEDMKYSDTPVLATVSENLADVYQDVKNFAAACQHGIEDIMQEATAVCRDNFEHYWGQRVVNVMRALHEVRYGKSE